jgi:diguanylate cyclase (GGDEF)-like protein
MAILIVDDSVIALAVFESMLKNAGYPDVITVSSAQDAFRLLGIDRADGGSAGIDLILMDIMMPEIDGIAACRRLKADERFQDIPVIIVSGMEDLGSLQAAFTGGATDYITKPANKIELLARVRSALLLKQEMDRRKAREKELLELTGQLEEANRKLHLISSLDSLTGVANRRYLDEHLEKEWKRAVREGTQLSAIMIDIDFFKAFNDTYGHQAGDDCLREVARCLQSLKRRPADLLGRYGGEEFIVLLPETGLIGAAAVAEGMCAKVAGLGIRHEKSAIGDHLTISLGVATVSPDLEKTSKMLITEADKALYRAKQGGRNRVELAEMQ